MERNRYSLMAVVLVVVLAALAGSAQAGEWTVESKDGESSIKFGYLIQGRGESLDSADGESTARNFYFRRLRLLAGGKLNSKWSFFVETDSPNLGKSSDGSKGSSDVYIQDFVVTYNHSQKFKVDFGMLLIPFAHNSNQSAATLLPIDYGAYSFLNSAPTKSRVGRDYGVAMRGHLAEGHLEYRLGVYDGYRGEDSDNGFRYAGRVVYYPFEAEKGLFYSGTSLGKKRVLAIGAGFDGQEDYHAYSADIYWDQPLASGDGLTMQLGFIRYDGDVFFPDFAEQDATTVEAGYYFAGSKIALFGTYLERDYASAEMLDEDRFQVGIAYYPDGFSRVLKLGWGKIRRDGNDDRTQIILQLQVLKF